MWPDLTQYIWILWLVIVVLFVIIELLTLEFTFLMLAAGSLLGGLGVFLAGGPWWLQIVLAAAVSVLLIFTIRPLLLRLLRKDADPAKSNLDALFGMEGRVLGAFSDGSGTVKLDNGETWTARASESLDDGARVVVTRVAGATVYVAPASPSAQAEG